MREKIVRTSKETGVPNKKVWDLLWELRSGQPVENNRLLQKIGVARNALNQVKTLLSAALKPPSKYTQLNESAIPGIQSLFGSDYRPEETLWAGLEGEVYHKSLALLTKYADKRPQPERRYDQFTATPETTARRASLLNFFEDVSGKRLLFLGDDDFTSAAVANLKTASKIAVLDIDSRILEGIGAISRAENLTISFIEHDARASLPTALTRKFDIVFTDPPYTTEGIKLFVSRAIQALDNQNQGARIYLCYGNSDKAKERFLPIYEIFAASGLMIRWAFDKFNRYHGAESIGSASSLFVLDTTPKTKALVPGSYDQAIYTNRFLTNI